MTVNVRSGINNLRLEAVEDETVEELLSRCGRAVNVSTSSDLNVIVDGEQYSYSAVKNDVIEDGSVVEFIQAAGKKN